MRIYNYDGITGAFVSEGAADPSPLEPGEWLIPAYATTAAPPDPIEGMERVFDGAGWVLRPDHRGEIWYTAAGEAVRITGLGAPPADLLPERPDLPEPVPAAVTRTQALLALLDHTPPILETEILAAIGAIEDTLQRERARILCAGPTWRRNDPFIAQLGTVFGLDGDDIDALFRIAATL